MPPSPSPTDDGQASVPTGALAGPLAVDALRGDPILAAERYRRASELLERAKEDLITSTLQNHHLVKVEGLAEIAGLGRRTLWDWVEKRRKQNGGL